ncbi:MAG TPA: hypothetical protein VEX41_08455 [Candidatus Eisenbacteria bacterium]|nr:hypothetical protein [Candidatus Eisenbacteria bacterium]
MKVTAARKATGMVVTAVAIVALAAGSAFAGQGSYHGNKYGAIENKPETELCADAYYPVGGDHGADINGNGVVCQKWTPSGYKWVDDSTSTTQFADT